MAYTKISVIDDGFPVKEMTHMIHDQLNDYFDEKYDWGYEHDLRELNQKLASEADTWNRNIHLEAFRHPEFFFKKEDLEWDIIVFDWEYNPAADSLDSLHELLLKTCSFIFVYTGFDKLDKVKEKTSDSNFSSFLTRFEVLPKDEEESKDKVLTKLKEKFNSEEIFTWHNKELIFKPSRHVTHFNEFWKIESLIGVDNLLHLMGEKGITSINENTINVIFSESTGIFYIDSKRQILSSSNNELITEHLGDLESISYADALSIRGIDALVEAREKGYVMLK